MTPATAVLGALVVVVVAMVAGHLLAKGGGTQEWE